MKDAYYFPHDSNAKDDPKMVLLIEQLGMEGYGIYWVLVETLRDQPGYRYPLALIPALARRYNTTNEKLKTVVLNYKLFDVEDDEFFFSESLRKRMIPLEQKREQARLAGLRSAEKRQQMLNDRSTDVQRVFNECSTSKVKESKGEESKTGTPLVNFITPTGGQGIAALRAWEREDPEKQQYFKRYEKQNGYRAANDPRKNYAI